MNQPRIIPAFDVLFPQTPLLDVVDVGSNPLENTAAPPTYAELLARGRCTVTGFEPGAVPFAQLQKNKGPHERYFPFAIGDGTRQTFYECALPVMSSLYEPDPELLKHFYVLSEAGKVIATSEVDTKRLDDIPGLDTCDYIHMDVQGAEYQCLKGASKLLKNTLVIQAETLFLPMYKKQPMFSEVEMLLRENGFMLHRFNNPQLRTWRPACVAGNMFTGWAQWFWCDAVFLRSVTTWNTMSADALLKMAALMHDLYRAFDLCLLILLTRDRDHKTTDAGVYLSWLQRDVPELVTMPKPA